MFQKNLSLQFSMLPGSLHYILVSKQIQTHLFQRASLYMLQNVFIYSVLAPVSQRQMFMSWTSY